MKYLMILAAMCLLPFAAQAEEAAPRVEGIVYDANRPAQSFALIDGEPYKAGDRYQDFEITAVLSTSVEMSHPTTGEKRTLSVEGAPPASPGPVPQVSGPAENFLTGMAEKLLTGGTPLAEVEAMKEIRAINMAAMQYLMNEGHLVRHIDLPALVRAGFLSRQYEDSVKGAYRFGLQLTDKGLQIRAEPVNKDSKLRYFLQDADGTLYYEEARPATRHSAFVDS